MAGQRARGKSLVIAAVGWVVAIWIFFPIFWMFLTSFKGEAGAIATPPRLFFVPTLESYHEVFQRANYWRVTFNTLGVSIGATVVALLFSIPAAYAMAFLPGKRTRGTLLWMLSTRMLPPVGVLVPIYLIARNTHLLDTVTGLALVDMFTNMPITVWMLYTFFREIPVPILEAGRMDGANRWQEITRVLLPLATPGIASTALLSMILCWNEAFWSLNLTSSNAAPLAAFIASFSSPEGLFFGKLSAASTLAVAPILAFGWISQKQLVRGLTFGAVK
ncbi:carbohydrate ABC transporter permease [Acetobacter sacchari]|uniref:Carbohydrate ABC transporter permease n=1 Tax=Acetobacter sacchari TaxID=2661687 RepID=A0ABS3LS43_9PROT|nr:carbohydrate ABC transporter permease [Acetobacter sacchari]MBO1358715.1 carbohydrate ABC transporter permease [Acetobacter sacchari]